MKKFFLNCAEKILLLILVIATIFGLFCIGNYAAYMISGGEDAETIMEVAILLVSVILSLSMISLLQDIHYMQLHIRAEEIEMEMQQDEEARKLFEHLRVK